MAYEEPTTDLTSTVEIKKIYIGIKTRDFGVQSREFGVKIRDFGI